MKRLGEEAIKPFVEGSPVAAMNEDCYRAVRRVRGEEIDRLQGMVSVGQVKIVGKGLERLSAQGLIAIEIILEIRVPSSEVELGVDRIGGHG